MRMYCPNEDTSTSESANDPESPDGDGAAAVADGGGGYEIQACGVISFTPDGAGDADVSESDGGERSWDGAPVEISSSASSAPVEISSIGSSGTSTDSETADVLAGPDDANHINDYLAGKEVVHAPVNSSNISNMEEFSRRLVTMQTMNVLSKSSCQHIFSLLQNNSVMLSRMLPGWSGCFKSARRRVQALVPPCRIFVVGHDKDGLERTLGPCKAFPKKNVLEEEITVEYTLYLCRLADIIALHAHLHGLHDEHDRVAEFDLGLDGVPESKSGGVSIDVLSARFVDCRSVYTLGVLRPRRTGLNISDAVILREVIGDYKSMMEGNTRTVNVAKLRYVICDAPKRARLLSQVSHSGYFSCPRCHIRGEYIGRTVCFPPEPEHVVSAPRTLQTVEDAVAYLDAGGNVQRHLYGVKGPSLLRGINNYDYVRGLPQDRMHLIDLGVCRQLCKLMFRCPGTSSTVRTVSPAYMNRKLLSVRVVSEFSRRAREFNFGTWKAEEYRNLYMCLWPLVADSLPVSQREVWLQFVYIMRALMLLHANGFSPPKVSKSDTRRWLRKFAKVFKDAACGYNMHSFTHVVELSELGPLTSTSAVGFESHYGEMKKRFVSGTPSTALQAIQDCAISNLGPHICKKSIRVRSKVTEKTDDTIVFTTEGLVIVEEELGEDMYRGRVLKIEPTNLLLPGYDFICVGVYRLKKVNAGTLHRRVTFAKNDITGKGVACEQYVSVIPIHVLQEK